MWKSRTGFAKIALSSKCPVIPMFTENVRESFRAVSLFRPFFEWLYKLTKLPLVPLYGGFPVKVAATPTGFKSNFRPIEKMLL